MQTYSTFEAAKLLGCSASTIRREIAEGRLKAAKIRQGFRISKAEIEVYWRNRGGGALFDGDKQAE